MEDIGGIWRTVGGRRIFIKKGQDLEAAMKESGKFSNDTIYKELNINSLELCQAQERSNTIYANMEARDKLLIDDYTGGGYEQLNDYLRGKYTPIDEKMKNYLEKQSQSISDSISQYKLVTNLKLFRGQNNEIYKNKKVGDIFEEKGFFSTTFSKDVALDFSKHYNNDNKDYLVEINVLKNSRCLYVGKNGSSGYDEGEFLLDKNTKFKVIQIEKNRIILEVKND